MTAAARLARLATHYPRLNVVAVAHGVGYSSGVAAGLGQRMSSALLNTAYFERQNSTFRERLAGLARRTRHLIRQQATLAAGMYPVGTVYNFVPNITVSRRAGNG